MHTDFVSFQPQFQKTIQQLQVKHLEKKSKTKLRLLQKHLPRDCGGLRGEVTPDVQLRNRLTSA